LKRFWQTASVAPKAGGFAILLDGRPMHLPGGAVLAVSSPRLAEAIAAEWQEAGGAKGGEMSFADTPLTRLAGTAQERIAPNPGPTVDALARYAESDLLCYRAESPEALVHRQAREWQPWLDWAALIHDAPLLVTTGVRHVRQNEASVSALRRAIEALEVPLLAGLGIAVPALGSIVLGLALAEGKLDAAKAHSLACLDELFQAELWGHDAEADDRRRRIAQDVELAARFMQFAQTRQVA
jgi:chaperone required for assembly of F1-ATPase